MKTTFALQGQRVALIVASLFTFLSVMAQDIPTADRRATEVKHLDFVYEFKPYTTKEEWTKRAEYLRGQILFAAGLWPLPEKTPLNAKVFGLTDKGDYTVEKVYFESFPGHYVTGNLYKPKNATGKLPAVLCPHGHWAYGRLENQQLNSGQARAANFARQGYVAFTWDMVGYNDSTAISHNFASHKAGLVKESLWNVNLLGLQLWNSMRAVDFIASLPEVDANRLGVTGESGGGTQTFLLYAVDDRLKVSAPVNMISSTMQGGCLCENTPLLRVDTNNMEIGACMAPRPMMMIAATGDWTKLTPTVEFPAIQSIYKLFEAENKVKFAQFDAPHNYHKESREAVYGWFAHWLQGRAETTPIKEKSNSIPTLTELLVFYGTPRPANELNEQQLTEALIAARQKQFEAALPRNAESLEQFKAQYGAALKYALMVETPKPEELASTVKNPPGITLISRRGKGDLVALQMWKPERPKRPAKTKPLDSYVLLVSPDSEFVTGSKALIDQLVKAGHNVAFLTAFPGLNGGEKPKYNFIATYNRVTDAQRVQDVLTAIAYLNKIKGTAKLNVIGLKEGGLYAMLARAFASGIDQMVIDTAQFNNNSDDEFLKRLAIPGLRRAGDVTTAVAIAPTTPLLLHNAGQQFQGKKIADVFSALGKAENLQIKPEKLSDTAIVEWLTPMPVAEPRK
ncbi:MAG TPA: acetylxylan esterase [Blastocatellia bacterium]|nr:acetylxylan esterase [Blastocatellia bacterium]